MVILLYGVCPEGVCDNSCTVQYGKIHHSRKWIKQCTFSMGIELSSVLGIIMIKIVIGPAY